MAKTDKKTSKRKSQAKPITLKSILASKAIENSLKKQLSKISKAINKSVIFWGLAKIKQNLDKNTPKQLTFELNALLRDWQKKINERAKVLSKKLVNQTAGYVDVNLANQLKNTPLKDASVSALAVKTMSVKKSMTAIYERNLALIQSIPSDIIERYRQGFLNGISNFDKEAIFKLARQYQGISEKRARLIARDQTAKATNDYQQARAEQLGFEYYVWLTSKDERVSTGAGGHIHLDGRIYKYSEPTAIIDSYGNKGHCGDRVNCRCSQQALFILPTQELKKVKDARAGDYFILVEKK